MTAWPRLVFALALICSSVALACTDSDDLTGPATLSFLLLALAAGLLPLAAEDR